MNTPQAAGEPRLLIGVPAYRGAPYIAETLRSIRTQQFAEFHVLISVDNKDEETARVCEPYLADPRFRLVVQDRHLNWDGNINWLAAQDGYEFFCYWQQDDTASADYLHALVRFADDNPDFVGAFSDIEWIGDDSERWTSPSITGFPLTRALSVIETLNAAPTRGVLRKSAIARAGPIRRTNHQSAWEDLIWLAKLAREGNLGRVEGPVYYKRRHAGSVSAPWMAREQGWKREVWLEVGLGMLEAILPAVGPAERGTALAVVLQRLCWPKTARFQLYNPERDRPFAQKFLQRVHERFGLSPVPHESGADDIVEGIFRFWRNRDAAVENVVARTRAILGESGHAELRFHDGSAGARLLASGWSEPENWGAWSEGSSAQMRLSLPASEHGWRIKVLCRACANREHPQTVLVVCNGAAHAWRFDHSDLTEKQIIVRPREELNGLSLRFPDAISPRTLGMGPDDRRLGLALTMMAIDRLD
jgi:hypothetical protein